MADLEKKILEAPKLPNHIQGDGRHLMSLLKSFLELTAEQVNLANGFQAEDIDPETGEYPAPRNFYLSFTRLGGEFTWNHLDDLSNFAYYELRIDEKIGNNIGLLDRTVENTSIKMSANYSDTVYLFAVSKDGKYSNPSILSYSKARPDSPQDISFTKSSEGILITFLEIPSDCIGANIYINGKLYKTLDNLLLVTGLENLERIEVAYYDQFGEGERGELIVYLPDVTGFLVERNGSDLDFYWNPINIYGIKYVVKVGNSNSWEEAAELFRTTTNDKNRRIYPNTGKYYLLVKAYDDNGNYSKNATYQVMNNEPDISRNVILELDQSDTLYGGNKINVFYDPNVNGVTLDREAISGEYIFPVSLSKSYRARNWLEYKAVAISNNNLTWEDADFAWADAEQRWAGALGNVDGCKFKAELALKSDVVSSNVFSVDLNGSLLTDQNVLPFESQHSEQYKNGRWGQGVFVDLLTKLAYNISLGSNIFSLFFCVKSFSPFGDTILMTLTNENKEYLILGYETRFQRFYLTGSDNVSIYIPLKLNSFVEYYSISISQSMTQRVMYINTYSSGKTFSSEADVVPLGVFDKIYCYPNLEVVGRDA